DAERREPKKGEEPEEERRRGADREQVERRDDGAARQPARGIRETEQRQRVADAIGVDEHDRGAQQNAEGDRDEAAREDRGPRHRPHQEPVDEEAGERREQRGREDRQRGLSGHRGGYQEEE